MKSPIKMYYLKPVVVHDFPVETPKCMYKLASLHSDRRKVDTPEPDHVTPPARNLDIFDQNCQGLPGMAELEARQTDILAQLAQLKQQISSLKQDLSLQNGLFKEPPKKALSQKKAAATTVAKALPESLVVTISSSKPPHSLELLQQLLKNTVVLSVTSYVHSSVALLPKDAQQLKESLAKFKPPSGVPVVNLRLIWKEISSNAELLLSHTQISGEVNLLRYLSRSIDSDLTYDSEPDSLELDSLLDQCYLLARAKTKTERAGILQLLNKTLNKSSWLAGRNRPSLADVAAYSAIKQCQITNELSANLTKWYQKCASLVNS